MFRRDVLNKEMTKVEVEKELNGKGDYVQIDNITRFLKENPATDVKRFLYLKLTEVYERRSMFSEEADMYNKLIELSVTPADKVNYHIKATECYIKSGFFDKADLMMNRALGEVKELERRKLMNSIIDFYKKQAQVYEKEKRRSKAMKTYEKLLSMNIVSSEKDEINKKLSGLYKELGMVGEYMRLNKQ